MTSIFFHFQLTVRRDLVDFCEGDEMQTGEVEDEYEAVFKELKSIIKGKAFFHLNTAQLIRDAEASPYNLCHDEGYSHVHTLWVYKLDDFLKGNHKEEFMVVPKKCCEEDDDVIYSELECKELLESWDICLVFNGLFAINLILQSQKGIEKSNYYEGHGKKD